MDPQAQQAFNFIMTILPWVVTIVAVSVGGALLNNWLKIKNGYPLSNSWGMPLHPKKDGGTREAAHQRECAAPRGTRRH